MKNTIKLGSTYFVNSNSKVIDSLFNKCGTANGTFKRRKNDILFSNLAGELFAALVRLDKAYPFFVSCSKHDGKIKFMHGLSESDKAMLGISGMDWREIDDAIALVMNPIEA